MVSDATLTGDGTAGDPLTVVDSWYNSLAELQAAVSNDYHNLGGTDSVSVDTFLVQYCDGCALASGWVRSGDTIYIDTSSTTITDYYTQAQVIQILSDTGAAIRADFPVNTDNQTLSLNTNTLSISGGNSVSLAQYLDNTDTQAISLNPSTHELSITGNASTVDLSAYLDNTDTQLSEEQVQDYAWNVLSGTQTGITVTYNDAGNNVSFVATDASATNELQTISTTGTAGNITLSDGGGTLNLNVNDADYDPTNELQTVDLFDVSNDSLRISLSQDATVNKIDMSNYNSLWEYREELPGHRFLRPKNNNTPRVALYSDDNALSSPTFIFSASNNDNPIDSGYVLGSLSWYGYSIPGLSSSGDLGSSGVIIHAVSTENWSSTNRGTEFYIGTVANGTAFTKKRFHIQGDGSIRFNDAYTIPADDGEAGEVWTSDGAGNISWQAPGSNPSTISATAGDTITAGDFVVIADSDGKWYRADASDTLLSTTLGGIATVAALPDSTVSIQIDGTYTTTGLDAGKNYYISATPGAITATKPSAPGSVLRVVGTAISSTQIYLVPTLTYISL